jgi:NADPH-dependent glutamate synthase beta subunit-like oxidoreductase
VANADRGKSVSCDHGRVCYHPCETSCNRGKVDETVGINSVERFLGDEALKLGWKFAPPKSETEARTDRRRGTLGLTAAYHLRRLGHGVKIVEAAPLLAA